jgi:hypothetical protein
MDPVALAISVAILAVFVVGGFWARRALNGAMQQAIAIVPTERLIIPGPFPENGDGPRFLQWLGTDGEAREWVKHNIRFFWNSMDGVHVILSPIGRQEARTWAGIANMEGKWDHVFYHFICEAFIFTSDETNVPDQFVSGDMDRFYEILQVASTENVFRDTRMFVPFISERVLSFEVQATRLSVTTIKREDWWWFLIYSQMPAELRSSFKFD